MNADKVNWCILTTMVLEFGLSVTMVVLHYLFGVDDTITLIITDIAILFPSLLFIFLNEEKPAEFLRFRKLKLSSIPIICLFTLLTIPSATALNLFSQLYSSNVVEEASAEFAGAPSWFLFLTVAVTGPFCEELFCRGLVYRGYAKSGRKITAMLLSALIFALIHLNLNQATYAFFLGVMLVLLAEATDSLWSSFIFHFLFNLQSVVMMISDGGELAEEAQETLSTQDMVIAVAVTVLVSAVTLALAVKVLGWLAANENRRGFFGKMLNGEKDKEVLTTLPFWLAIIFSVGVIVMGYVK